MSDQQPKLDRLESATSTEPAAPDLSATGGPVVETTGTAMAAAILSPEQEETSPKPDAPRVEAATPETPKLEAPRIDAVTLDSPPLAEPGMVVPPGDRAGVDAKPGAAEPAVPGKRRIPAMAAVVALATVAGALGGALATAGLGKSTAAGETASARSSAFEASVARIDADIAALRASLEETAKADVNQFNKTTDRLDKLEKAQADPAAKLAKLSEAVDKLRAAQASGAVAAARDVTGSMPQPVPAPATAAAAAAAPAVPTKPEVARLPTVEGWVLRDVANGSALIEGRRGMYEVYAGDPVPGLGRVDAIRRQDGRWVVVTTKGLIVAR